MRTRSRPRVVAGALLAGALIAGTAAVAGTANAHGKKNGHHKGFEINIVHINDHHSHLEPDGGFDASGIPGLGDTEVEFDVGGFPQVVRKINQLDRRLNNVVKVHAGDAITGTLYYTLFKGEADARLMNEVCFDMFALGNHEFDDGDGQLADGFLTDLAADPKCDTPVLAANVVPEVGTPLEPTAGDSFIQPYVVKDFGKGQKVGFIGIDIAQKTKVSSQPLDTTEFLDEVETAQRYVDELKGMGIENIVLVTHYQYENDLALAAEVSDIDAIIGGDSHTLLGDYDAFGLNSQGDYPTETTNADGDPVCVVQAWQYSHVVGEMNLKFKNGKNVGCDGTPHLLVNKNSYTKEVPDPDPEAEEGDTIDVPLEGKEKARFQRFVRQHPNADLVRPDKKAQRILDGYSEQVEVLSEEVIGEATEPLCLERIPGQGRSAICPDDATSASGAVLNQNGGFIQQIVTDAFKARAFRSDMAIQNAGGVRIDIPTGDISIGDVYTLLPFANTLVELTLSGAEIETVLEQALDNFMDNGGSTGSYPYGSYVRWDVDLGMSSGNRVSNVQVYDEEAKSWSAIDPGGTYVVATNSFIASGRDGYLAFGDAFDRGDVVDTYIDYAQGFIDWIEQDAGGVVSVPDPSMFSTQNFTPAP